MKQDLTTKTGREKAFRQLEALLIDTLISAGVRMNKNTWITLSGSQMDIYLINKDKESKYYRKPVFASDINIHLNKHFSGKESFKISFGTSGSFSPEDEAPFWRTIHAANILNNWDNVCKISKEYFDKYTELETLIVKKYFKK